MGNSREPQVYRVRQLPLHIKDCGKTATFLTSIAPALGAADNIRVFSLVQEKSDSKTATVSFKIIPSILDNDREQWTLQAEVSCGRNIIVDTHFRDFTVLNEPQSCLHTVDCVAISGLASHPFGSWKHRESGSHYMWLRDRLPQDVPKLRSLIYGYDTQLFKSRSFQNLDDIARSFIASLREIRRSLSSVKPLILLAHSLGGIVVKRALVLLGCESGEEERKIFKSVKGLVFFGVPHKGMEISHLLAMVTKQPNEDLISRTLSQDSKLLSELDEQFANIALSLNDNIRFVYETAESQLTEQNPAGTWVRSETSYAVLVNKDSAIPPGTPYRNAIPVNKDHSNMVKFGEDDPVYQTVMSFVFDLTNHSGIQRDSHVGRIMSTAGQKNARTFSTDPFPRDSGFVRREDQCLPLKILSEEERPLRLLSLDGGGIRGLSSLYILQHLLVTVQEQDRRGQVPNGEFPSPRPCDYFDMIAGTSTGGLIAIMLGVLRMDIQTCIKAYVDMAPRIFPTEGWISGSRIGQFTKLLKGDQRFDPAPFEAIIKTLVREYLGDGATGEEMMYSQPDQGCKVFVCVTSEQPRHHFKFRTYRHPQDVSNNVAIWQACRATSAAPTYFPPVSIGDLAQKYLDGGLGYNNPTQALRDEATQLWPSRNISCIVSIGTGVISSGDVGTTIKPIFKTLLAMATDTDKVDREVKQDLEQRFPNQNIYFRFNVQHGLGVVDMIEWKEMHRVKTVTEAYLNENHRQVKTCADQILSPNTTISLGPVTKTLKAFSTIPFPKDPEFVGREDILEQLESEIANPTSQRWASLYGLGGIGKSQIAIEYSYRQKIQFPQTSTFWVHASSKARLEQSYAEIAAAVGILGVGDGKANVYQLVSNWLADKDNGPWLFILDNADDETVLLDSPETDPLVGRNPVKRRLLDYVPRGGHGSVLMTTRDRNCALKVAGFRGTPIEVSYMTLDESVDLLRKTLPRALQEEASELVKELGNVPLAMSQASAYIKMVPPFSILSYLEIFRRSDGNQAALLKEDEGDLRRDPGVSNAVITSWELSFYQIRQKSPRSAELLSLMSYLNRQAIPQFLIQGDVGEILFHKDLAPLLSFSLIRAEIGEDNFEMHRLVQTAMRHWLQSEGYDQLWKERAIERVAGQFPGPRDQEERWPLCEVLWSHVDEVLLYAPSSKDIDLRYADLLASTAWYLTVRGRIDDLAEERSTLALQILKHHFDDDADEVLQASGALAHAKMGLGQLGEARDLRESILKHWREKLGLEHADTLTAMHYLASSYGALGRDEEAENQLKHVVEVRARVLGTEHPDSLSSARLLAHVQNKMGKYEEAEKRSARVLEISRRCLGIKHITTHSALHDLSDALLRQDKLKEAEDELDLAISFFGKVFPPGYLMTLVCKKILAVVYMGQGRLNDAEELCISCLGTAQQVYGLRNRVHVFIMNQLALVYKAQGKFNDSLRLFQNVLEWDKIYIGPNHREILVQMFNLSLCYYDLGDEDRAIELMSKVLEKRKELFPANHPEIVKSARLLAYWKAEEGEIEKNGIEHAEGEEEGIEDAEGEEDESDKEERRDEEERREEESDEEKARKTEARRGKVIQDGIEQKTGDKDEIVSQKGHLPGLIASAQERKPRRSSRKRRRIDQ